MESADVVYFNVVTVRMDDAARWDWSLSDKWGYHQLSQAGLERSIAQMVFDLQRAFE